jgi:hypothetical protein
MATPKTEIAPDEIEIMAWDYIQECIENKKDCLTASG